MSRFVVGYCRVSTEQQSREGVSLEAQRARIHAWCAGNGYALAEVFEDAGLSGSRSSRPGLEAALAVVCATKGGVLVVYSLSRLSRSTRDTLAVADRLERAGADLASLTERIDTTGAAGRMVFRMLAVLAEFERDVIAERTRTALSHKRDRGEAVSRAPRGCRIVAKRIVADESSDGLALYRRACDLRSGGMTFAGIAEQLGQEGFRPERGRRFYASTVRYMTSNPRCAAAEGAKAMGPV